jgi:hypothetical protein
VVPMNSTPAYHRSPARLTQSKRTQTNVHERGVFANDSTPQTAPPVYGYASRTALVSHSSVASSRSTTVPAEVVVRQVVVVRAHERHELAVHAQDPKSSFVACPRVRGSPVLHFWSGHGTHGFRVPQKRPRNHASGRYPVPARPSVSS